nr:immunoglobulin heavy chain junction region [Macaca mulatta]MOX65253.1 immunoglobulin heavy chain junction region [Macaca mulatta]MOX65614.1 immunoglobulin heavy chain junction region [Macaca mulatta]MOX66690.1 immunoglobulin heavy chain junction region [Macaca mulatta]MOX67425.1 immunoglobulin heavy chain junction region [Macaca mulatta]
CARDAYGRGFDYW